MEKVATEIQPQTASDKSTPVLLSQATNECGSVRLSPFMKSRPKLWFIQLEFQFAAYGISSDNAKLGIVLRHLDEETIFEIANVLEEPLESDKYERIKMILIEKYSKALVEQLSKELEEVEPGDKKPSLFLEEIRALGGPSMTDEMLRKFWLQKLRKDIRELLVVVQDSMTLDKLAEFADMISERLPVAAVSPSSEENETIKKLTKQVHKLMSAATGSKTDKRFEEVHLSLIGPLVHCEGYTCCLTMIDHCTKWVEVTPIANMSAETVAKAFVTTWVSRFGTPSVIMTDHATQFEAKLFADLTKLLGCTRIVSLPETNENLASWHRLERVLQSELIGEDDWVTNLPVILLGLRTAYRLNLGCSSATKLYGKTLNMPGEFFEESLEPVRDKFVKDLVTAIRNNKPLEIGQETTMGLVHKKLAEATHVFVRYDAINDSSFQRPYHGPYKVLQRTNKKLYSVLVNGESCNFPVDILRPAFFVTFPK